MTTLGIVAAVYFVLARLAYVVGVGGMLVREQRHQAFTRDAGVEAGWNRFRRTAAALMNNDGVAFVLLALVTAGSLGAPWPRPVMVVVGALIAAVGIGVKLWAARTLGVRGYHWYNFFGAGLEHEIEPRGPYRWLRNPMYTVGYLQTYGLALILDSWPALAAAAFAHAGILAFYFIVEKPHHDRLVAGQTASHAARRGPRQTQPLRVPRS
jgi:protein-S-isoprenylcysteine O-methyltransferase Ste14